jgi:pimeloyl-ACP methyl ester carboxylesterase
VRHGVLIDSDGELRVVGEREVPGDDRVKQARADRDLWRELTWRQMQCELALLSPRSVHLIAEHSGHLINQEQPDIVIEAIRRAIALTREHKGQ